MMTTRPDPVPRAATTRVRRAATSDAGAVARLAGQLNYPSTPEDMAQRLKRLESDPTHAVFVAETADGHVVGWLHVHKIPLVQAETRAEVHGLVTEEGYRGQGAGRLLMQQAEQWAREQGCAVVNLRSNVIRAGAHAFYEKLGYENYKSQKAFRKHL